MLCRFRSIMIVVTFTAASLSATAFEIYGDRG